MVDDPKYIEVRIIRFILIICDKFILILFYFTFFNFLFFKNILRSTDVIEKSDEYDYLKIAMGDGLFSAPGKVIAHILYILIIINCLYYKYIYTRIYIYIYNIYK